MSLRAKSLTEVKTPRAITSRSILANQFSTWPGGVGRREVQMNLGVGSDKLFHPAGLMSREIVCDQMNLLATWLIGDQFREEGDKFLTGVARCGFAHHKSWRSSRPGDSGNTGSSRSKAWMAVFRPRKTPPHAGAV